jgi:uncharacterized protein CbrC (UPF0167 family)
MIRLHVTVEGQTEQRFVKDVLSSHLAERSVFADARLVLTSKDKRAGREYRGGFRRTGAYEAAKKDICDWMKADRNADARFTTMFDLYALPDDFPWHAEAARESDPYRRTAALETAFQEDIRRELNDPRFIPYIQLHEFEALILAAPQKLDWEYMEHDAQIARIVAMVASEGGNPELIDDGESTAPSKRIIAEIPEYDGNKATSGPLIAGKIGLPKLRANCAHFAEWLQRLEGLAGANP